VRLAIDVMGGDHAPDEIVKGCVQSLGDLREDDRLVLVGDEAIVREILDELACDDPRLVIEHASEAIGMDESPVEAIKAKKDSSIVRMALRGSKKSDDPVDAVLSAGNTGACVSAGTMFMRRLAGVHRPGIAVTIPTFKGPVVLCDAGANPEPRPLHLAQYGIMAEVYARHTLGIEKPRVAQLNIGAEEGKGTKLIKEARDLLDATPDLNFLGYIEARDMFDGAADVVVADGFVGNTALKLAEGLARSLMEAFFHELFEFDADLAMQLEPAAKNLAKKNDYHEYGGAPLLGVNGVCVICHGSSKAKTIASAIRNTRQLVEKHVNDAIVERLAAAAPAIDPSAGGAAARS